MTIYKNLIAGEWVGSDATKNINPSDTNEVVGLYADGTTEDTKNAIAAAKAEGATREQFAQLIALYPRKYIRSEQVLRDRMREDAARLEKLWVVDRASE